MKKALHYFSACIIIILFICFLAALYVGVDPNSNFSDRLRTVPVLKLILKERETAVQSTASSNTPKGNIRYKYIQNPSEDSGTSVVFDTELLLPDTDLYSGPSEDKKLDEKTTDVKRYRVLDRRNDWAQIEIGKDKRWISPKRKNLQYYQMPDEMRRIISGEGDFIDFPQSTWYDKIIGAKIRSNIAWNTNYQKMDTKLGIFYCDSGCFSSLDTILSMIELLRASYRELFQDKVELKKETVLPNIFLKSSKAVKSLACKGDYSLGLIKVDNFSPSDDTSIGVLSHEYTHHLNRVLLRLGGIRTAPRWVDEGLCEYFSAEVINEFLRDPEESAKIKKEIYSENDLDVNPVLGLVKKKFIIAVKPYLENRSKSTIGMFEKGENIPFDKLIKDENWKKNGRMSSESMRFYDSAWAVIAYLIKGNSGKNLDGFCLYLKDLRDGEKTSVSIFDYISIKTPQDLDKAVMEEALSTDLVKF